MSELSTRNVRGLLFVDYVRMIRGQKDIDWTRYLQPSDIALLTARIDPEGWYAMETFERFGIAILREIARGQLEGVQMWGRFQVGSVQKRYPDLVVSGPPSATIEQFRLHAWSLFDYAAVEVVSVNAEDALVAVLFEMGPIAEETACNQSLGFFVGLLETAGATNVQGRFLEKSWEGASHTLIDLRWSAAKR